MRRLVHWVCLLLLGAPWAGAVGLPKISGDLKGRLVLHGWGDSPVLDWQVAAQPEAGSGHRVQATLSGPGLNIQAELDWRLDGGADWRLVRGEVDLARWWRSLAARADFAGRLPPDFELNGTLHLTGEGALQGRAVSGRVLARVDGGAVGSATQKWSVPAWTADAELHLTPAGPRLQALHLNVPEAEAAGLTIRNIALAAIGEASARLIVERASADLLGGRIALRPFSLDPLSPEVNTSADLQGVGLGDLAALVPEALSEAKGQLSGRVAVHWSAKVGLSPGEGSLVVMPDAPATLRLKATPGFITQRVPERLLWLPSSLGVVARLLALPNPAYDTLRRIELGELPLQVEKMDIRLFPDGPDGARSAVAHIETRPPGDTLVKRVTFDVNLAGPLTEVLRLGSDDRVKISTGTKP